MTGLATPEPLAPSGTKVYIFRHTFNRCRHAAMNVDRRLEEC
jgi:hypothetical protein